VIGFENGGASIRPRGRGFANRTVNPRAISLIAVQRATAVAKWLVGMSGAGTVLAFAFYIQSYLSILSIKNDCVSLRFVANANLAAVEFAFWFLGTGMVALFAIALPTAVGIRRNFLRRRKAHKQPPLQPGHEFDGLFEFQVGRIANFQWCLVGLSSFLFFLMTLGLVFAAIGGTPEGILKELHNFELQCPPHPSDQGVSQAQ
jgi:hypothetical protein